MLSGAVIFGFLLIAIVAGFAVRDGGLGMGPVLAAAGPVAHQVRVQRKAKTPICVRDHAMKSSEVGKSWNANVPLCFSTAFKSLMDMPEQDKSLAEACPIITDTRDVPIFLIVKARKRS